ncbi:NAD-binding lipoprotein [Streptomyces sp. NPDC048603]|uniref:CASTOR/POLLUX-related putative ion channel n=1 Tax=Streptomyces sp. NPDC048603 TaxID=3365577 RepID=UPI00371F43B1
MTPAHPGPGTGPGTRLTPGATPGVTPDPHARPGPQPPPAPPLRLRLRYWFDTTMTRGTTALIGWLSLLCLAVVVPAGALLVHVDENVPTTSRTLLLGVWKNVAGVFKLGSPVGSPAFVALSLLVSLVGLFFASALVGLITAGLNRRIMDLRKGRSVVLEQGHTVLLGWSDQVFPMIAELAEANSNRRRAAVAVLADRDKVEMEDEIRTQVPRTGPTRVICRTGRTDDPADIALVGTATARSVIVLTPPDATADVRIVRTLLALNSAGADRPGGHRPHVVTAVRSGANRVAAELAGGSGTCVLSHDEILARLIVQTCRQPGLPLVYLELLDYAGDEIYMTEEPRLAGRTYGDALLAYDTSSVIGLRAADGSLLLNPPSTTPIGPGDAVVAISRDDDTVVLGGGPPAADPSAADPSAITAQVCHPAHPESVLLLGWNRRAPLVVGLLAQYAAPGSVLDVVATDPAPGDGPGAGLLKTTFRDGDVTDPETLRGLDVGRYDHVVVLAHEEEGDAEGWVSDGRTLVTLLHLRELERTLGREIHVVAEMNDDRSRVLAPVNRGDDFVVNGRLIALLLTQIAENRDLARLFDDLFSPHGSEISLRPASGYVRPGTEVAFRTVVESARRQGHSAIGYRIHGQSTRPPRFGVRINPAKADRITFAPGDSVIVVTGSRTAPGPATLPQCAAAR